MTTSTPAGPHTPDPIDMLRAWAPPESDSWSDARTDAELELLWQHIDDVSATPPWRARRGAVAAGAVAVLAFAGVGVAAAAGIPVPHSVTETFAHFFGAHDGPGSPPLADSSTAERVFSVPGPQGTRFEGWTASNSRHGLCVTTTFQEPGDESPPEELLTGGGQCAEANAPHGLFAEGTDSSLAQSSLNRLNFVWEAGDAVRAELRVSTGAVYPVAIQHGWLGGWYGIDKIPLGASATIVAYGPDGAVLGRWTAQDQAGCPDADPC